MQSTYNVCVRVCACMCICVHVCAFRQACPYLESDLACPATYYGSLRKGGKPCFTRSSNLVINFVVRPGPQETWMKAPALTSWTWLWGNHFASLHFSFYIWKKVQYNLNPCYTKCAHRPETSSRNALEM